MTVPHPGTFHHRSLFDREQRFDERFRIAGDYEFLLRELLEANALFVPRLIVEMGASGVSSRPANLIESAIESERARRLHGLASGPAEWAPHVVALRGRLLIERAFGVKTATLAARVVRALIGGPAR
jgi:hypothetical protein